MFIKPAIFDSFSNITAVQTTREGGTSNPPYDKLNLSYSTDDNATNIKRNHHILKKRLGIKNMALCKQVHSNHVKVISTPKVYLNCDSMITNQKDLYLGVLVADCVPIILFDCKNKVIAAIHAGWRGTKQNIVKKTLNTMHARFLTHNKNVYAFIGASISKNHYEVDETFLEYFPKTCLEPSCRKRKYHLDLKMANLLQLRSCQVPQKNIEVSPLCTYDNFDILFSHRRSKGRTGRMMVVIGIK